MKRIFVLGSILAVLLFFGGENVQASVVFEDNFDSGASPAWGSEVGSWHASGGVYYAQSPSNSPMTYSSLPFVLTDFAVDVDINNIQDGGVWLRSSYDSNGNISGVLLVTGGNGGTGSGLYWHTFEDGLITGTYNAVDNLFTSGVSDVHLHIVVSGDDYYVYLGNGLAASFTTSEFSSGKVALYDFSNQTFDNVKVSAVPLPSALILLGSGLVGLMRMGRNRGRFKL